MSLSPRFYWSSRDDAFVPRDHRWGLICFDGQAQWWPPSEQVILPRCQPFPQLISRSYALSYDRWSTCVQIALSQIASGLLHKVVLAQRKTLEFANNLDPFLIMAMLKERVPSAYHFCWSDAPHRAFLGASPERLYAREGRLLKTEAQAGTRPRGLTVSEDFTLRQELENSDKDRREHDWVQRELQSALLQLCEGEVLITEREVVQLPNVQHLRSSLSGTLKLGVTDSDILSLLHPTPAVCGVPRQAARETILSLEPFDRSFYTGAVGFQSEARAEFAVGIRSAFVDGNQLHLMAGAGIVAGSNALDEWNEIENKMGLFECMVK